MYIEFKPNELKIVIQETEGQYFEHQYNGVSCSNVKWSEIIKTKVKHFAYSDLKYFDFEWWYKGENYKIDQDLLKQEIENELNKIQSTYKHIVILSEPPLTEALIFITWDNGDDLGWIIWQNCD